MVTTDNRYDEAGQANWLVSTNHPLAPLMHMKNKQNNVAHFGTFITTVSLHNKLHEIQLYEYQINIFLYKYMSVS
jgi:hypothetical protein